MVPGTYREVLLHQAEVGEAEEQPGQQGEQGQQQDDGDEDAAQAVRQLLDGGLSTCGPAGQRSCGIR